MIKKNFVPVTILSSKKSIGILLKHIIDIEKRLNSMQSTIQELVEKEIAKNLGDKIHLIESTLRETILQKEILIEKGLMTREEINKKYEELRNKK